MQLQLLHQTTCLAAYYDHSNDWLFLDWAGDVTLPMVQEACVELATCFLHRPYACVLNNNDQVTSVDLNVAVWLATDFLPHMTLAGLEKVAWIRSPSVRGQGMIQTILRLLPGPIIHDFDNLADAIYWLQRTRPTQRQPCIPVRSAATQAKLAQEVRAFLQRLETKATKAATG
ncbi:hypothetical protein GCM10027422_38470 [Hymenobacter arcticus]